MEILHLDVYYFIADSSRRGFPYHKNRQQNSTHPQMQNGEVWKNSTSIDQEQRTYGEM
jgi:hypothetical protein